MEYDFYDMALSPMETYLYILVRNSKKNISNHSLLIWNAQTFSQEHQFDKIPSEFLKIFMPSPLPAKVFQKKIEVLSEGYKRIYQNFEAQIDDQIDEVSMRLSGQGDWTERLDSHQEKVLLIN